MKRRYTRRRRFRRAVSRRNFKSNMWKSRYVLKDRASNFERKMRKTWRVANRNRNKRIWRVNRKRPSGAGGGADHGSDRKRPTGGSGRGGSTGGAIAPPTPHGGPDIVPGRQQRFKLINSLISRPYVRQRGPRYRDHIPKRHTRVAPTSTIPEQDWWMPIHWYANRFRELPRRKTDNKSTQEQKGAYRNNPTYWSGQ